MKKSKGISKTGVAASVAGLAAIGAGAYYLLGPKSKAHQKKAKNLLKKMNDQIKEEVKAAKKFSTPLYHQAVDAISEKYAKEHAMYEKEIKALAKKLKGSKKKSK